MWAISADEPERLRSFRDDAGIEFAFLLDPEGDAFDAWGVRNERSDGTVPHPTVVVVDRERVARYVLLDENYRRRPPAAEVVAAAREAAAAPEPDTTDR